MTSPNPSPSRSLRSLRLAGCGVQRKDPMFSTRIFLALAIVLLSGCASKLLKPEPITRDVLTQSQGVLIGSFSRNPNAPRYYSQTVFFKNLDTNEKHEIKSQQEFNIFSGKTKDEFKEGVNAGSTFALTLPAGRYVLYNFNLYRPTGVGYTYYSSKTDFAIPFDVHPNSVNYLGELKLEGASGKNFFGMSVPAGGIWIISDKQERDVLLLKTALPQLPLESIKSVIPTKKDIFTPLVVLPTEQTGTTSNDTKKP